MAAWQQRPPVPTERQSPPDTLPRLKTLARLFRKLPTGRERLEAFGVSPSATAFSQRCY